MSIEIHCDHCGKVASAANSSQNFYVCTKCFSRYCGNACGQHTCPKCNAKTERKTR